MDSANYKYTGERGIYVMDRGGDRIKLKEKIYDLEFGYRKIKISGYKDQLYLVVVKGFGENPLMILTNKRKRKEKRKRVRPRI
ncbi:MAG: hypothetical protein HY934_02125 [Candidatus Firestonebacteria bacterium]|nr:hypothetical protein [Candidatus Firestonebacteria bacterium]